MTTHDLPADRRSFLKATAAGLTGLALAPALPGGQPQPAATDANREQVWTAVDDARTSRRKRITYGAAALVGGGVWLFVVLTR